MAHAPLIRTSTAPLFTSTTSSLTGNGTSPTPPPGAGGSLRGTMSSNSNSSGAPRMSSSSAFTSTTSLSGLTGASSPVNPVPPLNGQVVATSNIINQKADASRSLYQICVSLKQRLAQVPGFEVHMEQLEQLERDHANGNPVEALWQLFRTGDPLLTIYNALQPREPLVANVGSGTSDVKKAKMIVFTFIKACMSDLGIPPAECFVIVDLLGTDTTGFVKVTTVVNHVLDLAKERGLLLEAQPAAEDATAAAAAASGSSQLSQRDYIIRELVDTERKYVQDLENLHDLKKTLEQRGIISGDVVHQIFLNINLILDVQRRFLIRIESMNSVPRDAQQWGSPFVAFEESFDIYQPFIANQRIAAQMAQTYFDKIRTAEHPVAIDSNTLNGFLLKPMQRLVKYPMLLKDLAKKSEREDEKADLEAGFAAAERALSKANEAVNRDMLDEAFNDLVGRVDDWKNHRVDQFGSLLLHGVYTVLTGKTEQERDYEIYLFESILLCCKEIAPNKSKDKKDKTRSASGAKPRNKNAKLQLKGRIFMANVTEVISLSKPGSYTVQIWWKGDPGVESFTIRFQNEEALKKWRNGLDHQRKLNAPSATQSPEQAPPDFAWMRSQSGDVGALENPYAEDPDDDDEVVGRNSQEQAAQQAPVPVPAQAPAAPAAPFSGLALRSRAATGDSSSSQSLNGMLRQAAPKFAMHTFPGSLSLQTQLPTQGGASSPSFRNVDSYFSPVAESPASSRTSTTSGFFPPQSATSYTFPKSLTPQPSREGEHNRYTAPAMPRAPSRDGPSPSNAYGSRSARGTTMSVMSQSSQHALQQQQQQQQLQQQQQQQTLSQQQQQQQHRSRSYSTPDIQGQQSRRAAGGSQGNIPAVPGIPSHLTLDRQEAAAAARTSTGSPRNDGGATMRTRTQSPGVPPGANRPPQHQPQGSYGGASMVQFPTHPIHPRQSTPNPQQQGVPGTADAVNTANPANSTSPANPANPGSPAIPTQLKIKVNYDASNYMTLVVAFNITYQSLVDRIDAKLARFTVNNIGKGHKKLKYRDEDGDFVSIESDDDIQIAFMEWHDGAQNQYNAGVGEIELFCVGDGV